jgi:predicted permease
MLAAGAPRGEGGSDGGVASGMNEGRQTKPKMKTLRAMLVRFTSLFRRKRLESEMTEELRAHLDGLIERNRAAGMSTDEARYAALRAFGGVAQIAESARDERRSAWCEHLLQDVRYAVRQLRRNPAFTAVVVLTLALGIGANTAIFMVFDAFMWRPLPVAAPERLVIVHGAETYERFDRLRGEVQSLAGVFAVGHIKPHRLQAPDLGIHATEAATVQEVTGNFFAVLQQPALLGRTLVADDDRAGAPRPVVVLSHAYWQRRFKGDPAVLGQTLILNNVAVAIVGVMPPGFFGVDVAAGGVIDFWCPLWLKTQLASPGDAMRLTVSAANSSWLRVMGRLQPGVTFQQAQAELTTISNRDRAELPKDRVTQLTLQPGATGYARARGYFRQPLNILWIVAGIVLLVACANVGGLLLARGATRQREFAVRLALGAGRGRLMRQLVTESLLLALIGAALGLQFAWWGVNALQHYLGGTALALRLDPFALGFTTLVAVSTGCAFGLAPALRFSRLDLARAFNQHGGGGGRRQWLNRGLVVAQIALSFVLLAGAGLFLRTLQNLRSQEVGFARENVLQFTLGIGREPTEAQRDAIERQVLDALEALPGVRSATVSQGAMFGSFSTSGHFTVHGPAGSTVDQQGATFPAAGRRYLETKGIALLRGRDFTIDDERPGAPGVAVISEAVTAKHFLGADPLGSTLHIIDKDDVYTIVGVARDTKIGSVRKPAGPAIHVSYFHKRSRGLSDAEFTLRTHLDPRSLGPSLRAAVLKIAPAAEVTALHTVKELMDSEFTRERAIAELAGFFSVLTLTLAGLGLYGVLAFGVAQRTREIGVRIALGAQGRDVFSLVIGQGVRVAIIGCALGLAGAMALTRFLAGLLFGVEPGDPTVLAGTALLLLAAALIACWLPARRATKVDPMLALRAE